jgi:hypothetical protein
MQEIIKILGDFAKVVSFFVITALVVGFLIWNFYLVQLGFYEFNIIQARYIHTGILFLILVAPVIFFIYIILKKIKVKNKKISSILLFYCLAIFSLFFLFVYSLFVFPRISQAWGGAQPRVLSIIASETDIEYLASFGIQPSSPVITQNLCVAYENQEFILILLGNRVLSVKKDYFKGFNSLPAKTRDQIADDCSKLAIGWVSNKADWPQQK